MENVLKVRGGSRLGGVEDLRRLPGEYCATDIVLVSKLSWQRSQLDVVLESGIIWLWTMVSPDLRSSTVAIVSSSMSPIQL